MSEATVKCWTHTGSDEWHIPSGEVRGLLLDQTDDDRLGAALVASYVAGRGEDGASEAEIATAMGEAWQKLVSEVRVNVALLGLILQGEVLYDVAEGGELMLRRPDAKD